MTCLVPITPEDETVSVLGTGSSAIGFRERVEQQLDACQTVQVDFRGIFVTQAFVDELFGPLILRMGPALLERVMFLGCSDDTKAILNFVFASRLRDFSAACTVTWP
jgi:hypothetical protein